MTVPPADEGVKLETIVAGAAFQPLQEQWDGLVRGMPRPSPFLLHAWLNEWWRHYGEGRRLQVEVAFRGPRLVGALPLCVTVRRGLGVAEFMGGHGSALGDLLLAEGEDESLGRALATRAFSGNHDLADLFGLPGNSRLAAAFPAGELRLLERVEAPILDLTDGWDDAYERITSARTRQLHRRRRRRLSDLGALEVSIARTPAELEPALREAFRLHDLRWAGRPDGSEFTSPTGKRFHVAAALALARDDVSRIVLLKLDGKAIAFHYYLALCRRMYVHRLAFDPAFERLSPGLLNTLDAIQAAASEGAIAVEFLGGAERYKRDLSNRVDPLYEGLGLARGIRGHVVVASRLAAIHTRLRLKRSPALHSFYFNRLAPARRVLARLRSSAEKDPPSRDA